MSKVPNSRRHPSYRRHKPSGQAVVTLSGRDFYLGRYNSKRSHDEYDRLIAEWLAGGRSLANSDSDAGVSTSELALAYWRHARKYYHSAGANTGEVYAIKSALRLLRTTYGTLPVADFGPRKLKALQLKMIDQGLSRSYINATTGRLKRLFEWGVAEEMVPTTVFQALTAVNGLRRGHTDARETTPVGPVNDEVVEATLPFLPPVVADMVRLQRLTGCRPGEVCRLRPMDVDTSADVWIYQPPVHKNEHRGQGRAIAIGPRGQDVLRRYLLRAEDSCCFSPAESEKKRRAALHEARKTPLSCGNRPGTNRKRRPKRASGACYDTKSYRGAIHRAVRLANRLRAKKAQQDGTKPDLLPKWSPNRLRHTAATEIRRQFGLEAAQVTLGHASADVTEIYAEKDLTPAAEVARKIG